MTDYTVLSAIGIGI